MFDPRANWLRGGLLGLLVWATGCGGNQPSTNNSKDSQTSLPSSGVKGIPTAKTTDAQAVPLEKSPDQSSAVTKTEKVHSTPAKPKPTLHERLQYELTVTFNDVPLDHVIGFFRDALEASITCESDINLGVATSVNLRDKPCVEILEYVLKSHQLAYIIKDGAIFISKTKPAPRR